MPSRRQKVFKLVVLGDSSVGKTSIINCHIGHAHSANYTPTIGVAYCPTDIQIGETTRTFDVWDTAGQELYRSLVPQYARDADGALLVFDVTQRSTFENLTQWLSFLSEAGTEASIVVFGNKADLADERTVMSSDAEAFCQNKGLVYLEGSAKTNTNIDLFFETVAKMCVEGEMAEVPTTVWVPAETKKVCC
jgi:small GTP-binding protein